ncbi:antitoxin [Desulfovibrio sp. ZJ200]|uniref:type II toxin-antitoxin system BrnA family antitoxin n=1 Tax=Desulfovibrio sp. ZJ200 TaxID=2709792 RepID=UPI0013EC92B7|nr:antitoxin [Desulfovibrio sp. ZJ200]
MKATEFDKHFDNGESVLPFADMSRAERPNLKSRRVNVDFPAWMVDALDKEAAHLGVTRQSLVKVWIANCLTRDAHTTDHA